MKRRFIASIGCVLLLSGCSSISHYYPGKMEKEEIKKEEPKPVVTAPKRPESYPTPVLANSERASKETRLRRRKFIIADEPIESGYGAYGYILLLKEPRNDMVLRNKYIKMCEAYLDSFSVFTTSEKPLSSNKKAYFPTFWFLIKPIENNACANYVDAYNYSRARKMVEEIGLPYNEAPYLLAEQVSGSHANKNKRFYISLKRISADRMDETLNIWANKITSSSGAWEQGWDLDIIRLQLASFVSTYGDSVYGVMR